MAKRQRFHIKDIKFPRTADSQKLVISVPVQQTKEKGRPVSPVRQDVRFPQVVQQEKLVVPVPVQPPKEKERPTPPARR